MFKRLKKWLGLNKKSHPVDNLNWGTTKECSHNTINNDITIPKDSSMKYLSRQVSGNYQITKMVNGKVTYYGTYPLNIAKNVRDYLVDKEWKLTPKEVKKLFDPFVNIGNIGTKYLTKKPNGEYMVQKQVNGKNCYYGIYPLKTAKKVRAYCMNNNWEIPPESVKQKFKGE